MYAEHLEKLTFAHFFYTLGAGVAVGFLFVVLDVYLLAKVEPVVGIRPAQAVI